MSLQKTGTQVVYVNKKSLQDNQYLIQSGDELDVFGLHLIFLDSFLLIRNIPNKIAINFVAAGLVNCRFPSSLDFKEEENKDIELYRKEDYFMKSPRLRRVIEPKTIKLSSPPREEDNQQLPIILVVGPMLTMGITSAVMLISTLSKIHSKTTSWSDSWPQMVTSGAMLVSMLIWPLITQAYNKHLRKKKKKETLEKYTKYLEEKKEELIQERNLQRSIILESALSLEECIDILTSKAVNFWNRRIDQNDFLTVRIGIGSRPLEVKIDYPEEGFTIEENELRKKADQLVADFQYIEMVPISYSLFESKTTAVMGSEKQVMNFIHNVLLQLITFYSYEDLKIVMFTNETRKQHWKYLKYLGHSFNNERTFRFFATTSESTKKVADYLNVEIHNRLLLLDKLKNPKPHYLILIDDYDSVKRHDFITSLTELDQNIGFSILILENKLSNLPSKCNNFIMLSDRNSAVLKNSYEKQEIIYFANEIHYNLPMMTFTKKLSNIPIEFENGLYQLPDSISFLQMEQVGKVEQLNILNRWSTNDATTSLKTMVGVDNQGEPMYLDLHEKYHGPHGLIAGMTGSGKSEFIITYILSMAINYSPDDIAFILIDYKGGGLAFAFENKALGICLPHLAGTITNLDKAEMDRTLVSIDSEIQRRQRIFNKARDQLGESTIDIYKYQKFYKDGKLQEAIPHLFIICDEFAELKSQQPEFMDNLIRVARIGRSLGVHLILATQKPSGVVNEQIWSNTKFRVCLKVQDESDSKEMLKRPEAAHLKQAGRFYLQVGYDEYFALGQSGWCGAKYYPSDKIMKQVNKSVDFINDCGQALKSIQATNSLKTKAQGEQLAAIMKSIMDVAGKVGKYAKKLWLENIPELLLVDEVISKYQVTDTPYHVTAVIGEYDAPEKQEQGIVQYDYLEDGNTIIYSNDGTDLEMLLSTLLYASVKNHLVQEINFYIIDYGSETFRKYVSLPHIGGIVFQGEDEKYQNLFKLLKEELQKRKKLFAEYGGEYQNYLKNSNHQLPLKVIFLNNYDSIYENHPDIYDQLPDLVRDSERYGMIFFLTGNATNSVQNKIAQNFPNIYAFRLKDSSDYNTIFNCRTKTVPRDNVGRGVLKKDGIHEFQTASIVKDNNTLNEYLLEFIQFQKQKNPTRAKRIPTLPKIVTRNDIQEEISTLRAVPVGIAKKELEICTIDYITNLGNIITSNKMANMIPFVQSFLLLLKEIRNVHIIVIDPLKILKLNPLQFPNYYTDHLENIFSQLNTYSRNLIDQKSSIEGIVMIVGIYKLLAKLKDLTAYTTFLQNLKEYEKIGIILVEDAAKIKNLAFESWFTNMFVLSDGIWIGKGITDQNVFRISTISKEMTQDIKNDMGYVVSENSATLCRLIDFQKQEDQNEQ